MIPGILASMLLGGASAASVASFILAGSTKNYANVFTALPILYTSPDGDNWTSRTPPWSTGVICGRCVSGGGKFFLSGYNADGVKVAVSNDRYTWTEVTPPWPTTSPLNYALNSPNYNLAITVAYGNNTLVAVGFDKSAGGALAARMAYSRDFGQTWTLINIPITARSGGTMMFDVIFANGMFVAVGSQTVVSNSVITDMDEDDIELLTSLDGITWTKRSTPNIHAYATYWPRLAYGNGQWFLVASSDQSASGTGNSRTGSTYSGYFAASPDAINWTNYTSGNNAQWSTLNCFRFLKDSFYGTGFSGKSSGPKGQIIKSYGSHNFGVTDYSGGAIDLSRVSAMAYGADKFLVGGINQSNGTTQLTRLAKGTDGVNFTLENQIWLPADGSIFLIDYI